MAADSVGVSGVLAVVTVGLYLGHASARLLTATSRLQAINLWQVVDFLLEGLLFIIVGLELSRTFGDLGGGREAALAGLLLPAALVATVVIVVRLAWVFPATYGPRYVRRRFAGRSDSYPPWQTVFFEGWAGLRGAVSLVLALSIPFVTESGAPFPGRELVIFLTFVVILVTLVGQGLTLRPLIGELGLEPDFEDAYEETRARLETARAALARLEQVVPGTESAGDGDGAGDMNRPPLADGDPEVRPAIDRLYDRYVHLVHRYASEVRSGCSDTASTGDIAADPDDEQLEAARDERIASAYQRLRLEVIEAERTELIRLRDVGEISDGVLHRVERDLDLEQSLLIGRSG
jgi:CPA1 family monovalent cation:H+ antiporter